MTDYYVFSSGNDSTGTGTHSAPKLSLIGSSGALTIAGLTAGDRIFCQSNHSETNSSINTITITIPSGVQIISTSDTTNDPPQTYAKGYQINFTGDADYINFTAGCFYGIVFYCNNGSYSSEMFFGRLGNRYIVLDNCDLKLNSNTGTYSRFVFGLDSSSDSRQIIRVSNCNFYYGNTAQAIVVLNGTEFIGCNFSAGSTHPGILFKNMSADYYAIGRARCLGCDMSVGNNTVTYVQQPYAGSGGAQFQYEFIDCKISSGTVTWVGSSSSIGDAEIWARNCSSGDKHFNFVHQNSQGRTEVATSNNDPSVYITVDGAMYDGSNPHGWLITTTSRCSNAHPYVSPWIDVYVSSSNSITPYLECLRKGSTTKYKDNEVWAEILAKDTSGSVLITRFTDRFLLGSAAADQATSSLSASDWTGEDASNNAFFKLDSGVSFSPDEIGYLRMRIVVGKSSVTDLYVDPQIRGLS
jgi:hypothetical protein